MSSISEIDTLRDRTDRDSLLSSLSRNQSELHLTVLSRLASSRKRILLEFCLELKIESVIKLNLNMVS